MARAERSRPHDRQPALSASVARVRSHRSFRFTSSLPPSSLTTSSIAYSVARDLLLAVLRCSIRDAKLRDEAVRSAKSACLNTAEGAGRVTRADKARAFAIARAETVEAAAAVEIAALCGDAPAARAEEVARIADRLVAMLTGLVR